MSNSRMVCFQFHQVMDEMVINCKESLSLEKEIFEDGLNETRKNLSNLSDSLDSLNKTLQEEKEKPFFSLQADQENLKNAQENFEKKEEALRVFLADLKKEEEKHNGEIKQLQDKEKNLKAQKMSEHKEKIKNLQILSFKYNNLNFIDGEAIYSISYEVERISNELNSLRNLSPEEIEGSTVKNCNLEILKKNHTWHAKKTITFSSQLNILNQDCRSATEQLKQEEKKLKIDKDRIKCQEHLYYSATSQKIMFACLRSYALFLRLCDSELPSDDHFDSVSKIESYKKIEEDDFIVVDSEQKAESQVTIFRISPSQKFKLIMQKVNVLKSEVTQMLTSLWCPDANNRNGLALWNHFGKLKSFDQQRLFKNNPTDNDLNILVPIDRAKTVLVSDLTKKIIELPKSLIDNYQTYAVVSWIISPKNKKEVSTPLFSPTSPSL